MLEASQYPLNGFLTLTYADEFVPKNIAGNLNLAPVHLQKFWKRLRAKLSDMYDEDDLSKIRYYAVGEYGEEGVRAPFNPHYHAALFNFGCLGKIQRIETGLRCYCANCELVLSCWPFGHITLDELSDQSASYIAGYVVKKMNCWDDVRLEGRHPEFARMSKGIAREVVPDIAAALKTQFGHLAYQLGDVPASLVHGTSSKPLGRYLRKKLRESVGLEKVDIYTGEVTYGAPYETLSLLQQQAEPEMSVLRQNILDAPQGSKAVHYEALDRARVKSALKRKQRILNFEAKSKIFEKGKKL